MLKFTIEVDINETREAVVGLMHPDNLSKWLSGFVKMEHISGPLWEEGSKYDLHFKTGHYAYKVEETYVTRNLPEEFSCLFEEVSLLQISENWLKELPNGKVRWVSTQTITGKKMSAKLMMTFMPWIYKSITKRSMMRFKSFAET